MMGVVDRKQARADEPREVGIDGEARIRRFFILEIHPMLSETRCCSAPFGAISCVMIRQGFVEDIKLPKTNVEASCQERALPQVWNRKGAREFASGFGHSSMVYLLDSVDQECRGST